MFHYVSKYDYSFIIKSYQKNLKTINLFRKKHWEIHNLYSYERKKVTRINKNGEEITNNISDMFQLIDSARFMTTSLSNLVNNFSGGFHGIKHDMNVMIKKMNNVELFISIVTVEYTNFKDNLIEYSCSTCNKNCQRKFYKKL